MGLSKRKWFSSLSRYRLQKNMHLRCNLNATESSNLITQLCIRQIFSDLQSSFFFSQELSQWIPLGVKGQIRNLFEIFSFDDAILEIIGFEAELHHQKIFSPKTLQICKDTYHFDNNHESNLKPYWNREMIKECVNIIAIKTFINLVFSSKEFHFFL